MFWTITDIIRFISIFQFAFFALFLAIGPQRNRIANRFLALFLVSKALCYLHDVLLFSPAVDHQRFSWLLYWGMPFDALLGPALYLYLRASGNPLSVRNKWNLLHAIPFVLILIYVVFAYQIQPAESRMEMLRTGIPGEYQILLLMYIHFIIYTAVSMIWLGRRQAEAKRSGSYSKRQFGWRWMLLTGFCAIWSTVVLDMVSGFVLPEIQPVLWMCIIGLIFLFSNTIIFEALRAPEVLSLSLMSVAAKYKKNPITDQERENYSGRLAECMRSKKPFRDSLLTLEQLAATVGIPAHTLSQIINTHFGYNFNDYVNKHRVEECQIMMNSENADARTSLDIAFDCGFNSKSVFNHAFKKFTGLTPSQYRKVVLPHSENAATSLARIA